MHIEFRRKFVLRRAEQIIHNNGPIGNCKEIREGFISTQSHTYIEIGSHLYEYQVNKNDVGNVKELSQFFNSEELQKLGLKSAVKKKLAFKKAFAIFQEIAEMPGQTPGALKLSFAGMGSPVSQDSNNSDEKASTYDAKNDDDIDIDDVVANAYGQIGNTPGGSGSPKPDPNVLNLSDTVSWEMYWTFYFKQVCVGGLYCVVLFVVYIDD